MKKIAVVILMIFYCTNLQSQAPQHFDLYVQLKDKAGEPLRDVKLDLQVEVRERGTVQYKEAHADVWTNYDGYISIRVGGGSRMQGTFSDIDWRAGNKIVFIEGRPASASSGRYNEYYSAYVPTTAYAHTIPSYRKPGVGEVQIMNFAARPNIKIFGNTVDNYPSIEFATGDNNLSRNFYTQLRLGSGTDRNFYHITRGTGFNFRKLERINNQDRTVSQVRMSLGEHSWIRLEGGNSAINFATAIGDENRLGKISINKNSKTFEIQSINGAGMYINSSAGPISYRGSRHNFRGPVEVDGTLVINGINKFGNVNYVSWGEGYQLRGSLSFRNTSDDYFNQVKLVVQNGNLDYAVKTESRMRAQAFHATSDSRIKIKIDSAISDSSIPTLLAIKPTLFGYKDWLSSGTKLTLGFIAQEIEEVLPQVVSFSTNVIPDILQTGKNIAFDPQNNTLSLEIDNLSGEPIKPGDKIRLIGRDQHLLEVITCKGRTLTFKDWPEGATEEIFVYGREVDDFRNVDYNQIFTLNVAATQALVKEIDTLRSELSTLKSDYSQVSKEKSELRNELNNIHARLDKLSLQINLPQNPPATSVNKGKKSK